MTFRDFMGACALSLITGAALALLIGCSPSPTARVLVGVGCGPDRLTMAATEEDAFPFDCEAIEPVTVHTY